MSDNRQRAVEAYVKALRTGEASAAAQTAEHLASDVIMASAQEEIRGRDKVLARVTGQWPLTPVYALGAWSSLQEHGDRIKVDGQFSGLGAAPAAVNLTFSFNAAGQISRVDQETTAASPMQATDRIPDFVRGYVNSALANGTPVAVAYVDETGQPVLSLRGSTQVYGDTQLCIWLRNVEGGLNRAIATNPKMSVLYRDSKTRTTINFQGRGRIEPNEEVRDRVFALAPEVEQNHDPNRRGAALIIDVDRMTAVSPKGNVRMTRAG